MTTIWILAITLWILGAVASSIHLILLQRRPTTALAWILGLWFIPFVGVGWYLIFGIQIGPRSIRRRRRRKRELRVREPSRASTSPSIPGISALETVLERCSAFPALPGHQVRILDEPIERMLEMIGAAQREILLESYTVSPGPTAEELAELLLRRAAEGLEVKLLIDPIGSLELPRAYLRRLQAAGIAAAEFLEPSWLGPRMHVNLRNHRKLLVIDSELACLGSANWSDDYRTRPGSPSFSDLHVSIRGASTSGLRRMFLEDWSIVTGDQELAQRLVDPADETEATRGGLRLRILPSGPDEPNESLFLVLLAALRSARRTLLIVTPYFVPGEAMMQALRIACLSGVQVRILMPERSDSRVVDLAARHYFPALLEAGAEIWLREPPFLHAKAIVVDGVWSTLGSANFDLRSFHLNYELNVDVTGTEFAAQLERHFHKDFDAARCVEESEYSPRGIRRLMANAAALLEPML
ncbi:MAG: phospholipase D-like domain-containing protein [Planctomycetota bacterium]